LKQRIKQFVIYVFIVGIYFSASIAIGCASCGSGGDDPLILYPNERLKFYAGVSQISHFKNVDPDGSLSTAGGPTSKQSLTTAGGFGFNPRSFMTLTIPFLQNSRGGNYRTSAGDPSVAGRYTIVMQSIDEPVLPQVQLIYGYKHAHSRSLRESRELKTQMDVFGTGFSEVRTGADVWFGITRVKPGISLLAVKPLNRSFNGRWYEPSFSSRLTGSIGYSTQDNLRFTAGTNREQRGITRVDGTPQSNTQQLNHSAFITSDWMMTGQQSMRLSISRQAAYGKNYNTAQSDSVSLAYMQSF
jgi:hypothetical protein